MTRPLGEPLDERPGEPLDERLGGPFGAGSGRVGSGRPGSRGSGSRGSARWAVCVVAAAFLGSISLAGSALAAGESGDPPSAGSRSGPAAGAHPHRSSGGAATAQPARSVHPARSVRPPRVERPVRPPRVVRPARVKGTPCTADAVACVSISEGRAWLFDNGAISHGPVDVATGGPGEETPVGDHEVQWKDKNHKSSEHTTPDGQPSPMPYSVFFADGGVAFHEGTLERRSAGCVRLEMADAQRFYTFLQLGDKVQVQP